MRLFEIVLIVLTFVLLLFPRSSNKVVSRGLAIVTILTAVAHAYFEGIRWPMALVYGLGALAVVLGLLAVGPRWRWTRIVGALVLGLGAGLALLFPIPNLPELSGEYDVGTVTYHLVDNDRPETFTDDPDDVRELMVQVWYPAEVTTQANVPYIADIETGGPILMGHFELPTFLLNHTRLIESPAFDRPPIVSEDGALPVILFSHGLGGVRGQNTLQALEFASHGYVVIAADHAYASAYSIYPDGDVAIYKTGIIAPFDTPEYEPSAQGLVSVWAEDLAFVADTFTNFSTTPSNRFYGALNMGQLGVMGHSTGGGTAYEFCYRDERCKAAMGLDPWLIPVSDEAIAVGLEIPMSSYHTPTNLGVPNSFRRDLLIENSAGPAYALTVEGTAHFDFSDFPMLSKALDWAGFTGPIGAQRTIDLMNVYSMAFFDHHIRGWGGALLFAESAEYPEVTLIRK